ncbi:MAG: hypothetical protein GVY04_09940 [Cyanobacteria bacterium]|jgi:hypothetical protein|nr:hypothetical protein [Cyanobacteria bacterium GSL.Bin1]
MKCVIVAIFLEARSRSEKIQRSQSLYPKIEKAVKKAHKKKTNNFAIIE